MTLNVFLEHGFYLSKMILLYLPFHIPPPPFFKFYTLTMRVKRDIHSVSYQQSIFLESFLSDGTFQNELGFGIAAVPMNRLHYQFPMVDLKYI